MARLPAACRPAMLAAAAIYAEIGREVTRRGCDSVSARARVGARRKLALVAAAALRSAAVSRGASAPPLPAAMFLVEAVAQHRSSSRPDAGLAGNAHRPGAGDVRAAGAHRADWGDEMPQYAYGLIEMGLTYGVVLSFLIWQLVKTRASLKADRERRA